MMKLPGLLCAFNASFHKENTSTASLEVSSVIRNAKFLFNNLVSKVANDIIPPLKTWITTGNSFQKDAEIESLTLKVNSWLSDHENDPSIEDYQKAAQRILHFLKSPYTELNLTNLKIKSLPDVFESSKIDKLEKLYLNGSKMLKLPENLNFSKLKILDLSRTQISSLPQNLTLPKLERLNLSNTRVTTLSRSSLKLPAHCPIILPTRLTRSTTPSPRPPIRRATNLTSRTSCRRTPDFSPRPPLRIRSRPTTRTHHRLRSTSESSLNKALLRVFASAKIKGVDLKKLTTALTQGKSESDRRKVEIWLNRLFQTASANSKNSEHFFKSVVETLKHSAQNPEMKSIFYAVLETACTTCGDRIALSTLHFDIQRQLAQLDISQPREVYNFLIKCVFVMDKLENFASNTVLTLPDADPLEVYLGLPITLKDEFEIPINISCMRFFRCSDLTNEHLDQARSYLYEDLNNEAMLLDFLVQQPKWVEVLSNFYPEDMNALTEKKEDEAIDPETAENALQNYQSGLKALTTKIKSTFV